MDEALPAWLQSLWKLLDSNLREINRKAKRWLTLMRLGLAACIIILLANIVGGVMVAINPAHIRWAFPVTMVVSLVPLLIFTFLLTLPLRFQKLTRIIDKGYPENMKELAIRLAARKMRDQSIETEELLVETAWNETKKVLRKVQQRKDAKEAVAEYQAAASEVQSETASPDAGPVETPQGGAVSDETNGSGQAEENGNGEVPGAKGNSEGDGDLDGRQS